MQSVFSKVALLSILLALCVNSQGLPFYFDPMGKLGGQTLKLYALVSTGTQYINTGISGASTIRVIEQTSFTALPSAFSFGSRTSTSAGQFAFVFITANFRDDFAYQSTTIGGFLTNTLYTVDKNRNVTFVYLSSGSVSTARTNIVETFSNSLPIYIFGINNNDALASAGSFRKRSFKIYANDVLLFDGIPVPAGDTQYLSTPAPSNCMFDNVSKTYFVNQGTGSFGIEEVK